MHEKVLNMNSYIINQLQWKFNQIDTFTHITLKIICTSLWKLRQNKMLLPMNLSCFEQPVCSNLFKGKNNQIVSCDWTNNDIEVIHKHLLLLTIQHFHSIGHYDLSKSTLLKMCHMFKSNRCRSSSSTLWKNFCLCSVSNSYLINAGHSHGKLYFHDIKNAWLFTS